MELSYEVLFEDKFIFDGLGRYQYYGESYLKSIKNNKKIKSRIAKNLWNVAFDFLHKKDERPNILLLDYKFEKIYREQSAKFNFVIICNSFNQVKKHIHDKNAYFPNRWLDRINESFISHNMIYAEKALEDIKRFLYKKKIEAVLVGNDKTFIEKALVLAAKELDVPTIAIQHGIYNLNSFRQLKTSYSCDYFWTWSQYVKDIYIDETKRRKEDVVVIGYPFELPILPDADKNTVLFLGNHYKTSNYDEGIKYLDIAKNVYKICTENGFKFKYRPHPAEILDDDYGVLLSTNIEKNISLDEDLSNYDIVIGDVSSVMIEAAIRGRKVIQVIWSDRSRIGIEDPLYAFTYKCRSDYDSLLSTIVLTAKNNEKQKVEDYYLHINPEFSESIEQLLLQTINDRRGMCV